jgi:hypothetical protein
MWTQTFLIESQFCVLNLDARQSVLPLSTKSVGHCADMPHYTSGGLSPASDLSVSGSIHVACGQNGIGTGISEYLRFQRKFSFRGWCNRSLTAQVTWYPISPHFRNRVDNYWSVNTEKKMKSVRPVKLVWTKSTFRFRTRSPIAVIFLKLPPRQFYLPRWRP